MKRRDMIKLMSLAILPIMPGGATASSDGKKDLLRYKVFTVTRPGLNRDVPPGKESLMWVANSSTLTGCSEKSFQPHFSATAGSNPRNKINFSSPTRTLTY